MNESIINAVTVAAKAHSIEPAALLAVFEVESSGVAFWNVDGANRPPIRFEGHYFYARLNGVQRDKAVKARLASPKAGAIPNPSSYSARYALLDKAKAINATAALESTSWGLGQVMGANWRSLGYASVNELVAAANTISGQVDMVVKFIEANGLKDDINAHNWLGFKNGYNGKKANGYDTKIAKAYNKYAKTTDKPTIMVPKAPGATHINTGAATAAIGTAAEAASGAGNSLQGIGSTMQIIQIISVLLILVGVGLTCYGLYKRLKK